MQGRAARHCRVRSAPPHRAPQPLRGEAARLAPGYRRRLPRAPHALRQEPRHKSKRALFELRQLSRLVVGDQRIDYLVESLAAQNLVEFVEREIDAVVSHAALRKIVGADALRAVARPDLVFSRRRALALEFFPFYLVEARAQDIERLRAVLMLRARADRNSDAGRNVRHPDR